MNGSLTEQVLERAGSSHWRTFTAPLHEHRWAADGTTRRFSLPSSSRARLLEVESPPGRTLRRGRDYRMHRGALLLRRAPAAADEAVLARLAGEAGMGGGFIERRPSSTIVHLEGSGSTDEAADAALDDTLASFLSDLAGRSVLEGPYRKVALLRRRLLRPVATVQAVERRKERGEDGVTVRVVARVEIVGELELIVGIPDVGEGAPVERVHHGLYEKADHYVTAVRYDDAGRSITHLHVHHGPPSSRTEPEVLTTDEMIALLEERRAPSVRTAVEDEETGGWRTGSSLRVVRTARGAYLRTDPNERTADNLASLPQF